MTKMLASWMPMVAPVMAPASEAAACSAVLRSSKASRRTKMVAALDPNEKLDPSKPANDTTPSTPSVLRMICEARDMTSCVRSSEAPGGSCTTPIRNP